MVTVPALPGCVSQGDTHAEALAKFREAILAYVEALEITGEPIPVDAGCETVEVAA